MRYTKSLPLLLLFSCLLFGLLACEGSPDPKKNPITQQQVLQDLPGQTLSGLGDKNFKIEGPLYVDAFNVDYDGKAGTAHVQLRTVNLSSKEGINGEIKARYQFSRGTWKLQSLTAEESSSMSPAYAQRLTELVDFPVHFAANIGDLERVVQELESGADVNAREGKKNSTAVMFASERGFLPIVKLLVEKGADVSMPNKYGYTALHASSNGKHIEVAKYLIDNGADVNAVEEKGRTPLFFAAEQNSLELARILVENGAEVDRRDNKQWTPLYAAVDKGSLEIAEFLIEHGAKVKSETPGDSRSPLLSASYSGNLEMVKLLIDAGADVNAKIGMGHSPYKGMNALQIAQRQGHEDVAELLKSAGAN